MQIIKPTKPVLPKYEDYIEEIKSIWETGAMTNNGPKLQKFKAALVDYTGGSNIDLFVNGHAALLTALKSLDLHGEVITSPFTFVSTTNAIVQAGLTPVFSDIDSTYNLDPNKIERHITEKTCAIVTPHIFGIPCDVESIQKIADQYGLKVIYDGAQAFGTKIGNQHIGNFGDITMFSFHAIKVFNSIEGGMLMYRNSELQQKFELYRNFGINYNTADVELCGYNAKMNEFQAAMGLVNLPGLETEIKKRCRLAEAYRWAFAKITGLSTFSYQKDIRYNFAYYPVRVDEKAFGHSRDELYSYLQENGVLTRKLYNQLTCDNAIYKNQYSRDVSYAESVAESALDFPIYGDLSEENINYITEVILQFVKR